MELCKLWKLLSLRIPVAVLSLTVAYRSYAHTGRFSPTDSRTLAKSSQKAVLPRVSFHLGLCSADSGLLGFPDLRPPTLDSVRPAGSAWVLSPCAVVRNRLQVAAWARWSLQVVKSEFTSSVFHFSMSCSDFGPVSGNWGFLHFVQCSNCLW